MTTGASGFGGRDALRRLLGDRPATRETSPMGFDATRQQRRRRTDPWIVAAAIAVCVLLVLWALLG